MPYLGGGFGSKSYTKMEPLTVALARKAGRPVRIQNRVAESMVTTRRHNMTCRMRTAATADGRLLAREVECPARHGRLRRQRPARRRDRRRRCARPLPLGRLPRRRVVRLHEPRAGRLVPRLRRDAPPVDRRVAGRRGRAAGGPRPARGPPAEPAHPRRGGALRRQAARRRPRRRRREGRGGGRLGHREAAARRAGRLGRPARGRGAPRVERRLPARGRRPRRRARRDDRDGPGPANRVRADRRRGDRRRAGAGHRARRRHALHAVRPLDRREPLDDDRRARRPACGRGHPRAAGADRGHQRRSTRASTSR